MSSANTRKTSDTKWWLNVRAGLPYPVIELDDARSHTTVRRWSGPAAGILLAFPGLKGRIPGAGCYSCDKYLYSRLMLASACAECALRVERPCEIEHAEKPGTPTSPDAATDSNVLSQRLLAHGIHVTPQRLEIAAMLFAKTQHVTADDVYRHIRKIGKYCSRATVYNTLNLFAGEGLLKALTVGPDKTFFDTVTTPHPHVYNVDTGE
ncbi:MAG: transcriptional repressor, partial [Gammaproteobacteria bacterium]|nr:transcriptional repressor [Gammaproteobacteria bacterium]